LYSPAAYARETTGRHQQDLKMLSARTRSNRMCVVRQFCHYLAGSDPQTARLKSMHLFGCHIKQYVDAKRLSEAEKEIRKILFQDKINNYIEPHLRSLLSLTNSYFLSIETS
jgi:hypothetical protein